MSRSNAADAAEAVITTVDTPSLPLETSLIAPIPFLHIKCDAVSCPMMILATTATVQCSTCRVAYYCSDACLVQHHAVHQEFCQEIVSKHWNTVQFAGISDSQRGAIISIPCAPPQQPTSPGKDGAENASGRVEGMPMGDVCSICLDDPNKKIAPVVTLQACKHVFCLPCLIQWKRYSNSYQVRDPWGIPSEMALYTDIPMSHLVCPTCRTLSDDPEDFLLLTAKHSCARGKHPACPPELKSRLLNEAFMISSALLQVQDPELIPMFILADVLLALNRPGDAVVTTRRLMKLDQLRHTIVLADPVLAWVEHARALNNSCSVDLSTFTLHRATTTAILTDNPHAVLTGSRERTALYLAIYLLQGEAFMKLAAWPDARRVYQVLMMDQAQGHLPFMKDPYEFDYTKVNNKGVMGQIWRGLSICNYEMGEYEWSLKMSTQTIVIDRTHANVHRCKAMTLVRQAEQTQSSEAALEMFKQAVSTIHQGVLYESPCDPATRVANLELFHSLQNELKQKESHAISMRDDFVQTENTHG